MGEPRTIGIAGCGVAGLAAAALLARSGARVVVFDRLQTPQPLGSGLILQPAGLAVMEALGAGDRIRALGAPIRRLLGKVGGTERTVLDVRYDARGADAPPGLAVHRGALFETLLDAARESGAVIEAGRDIRAASDGRFSFADGTQSARFDLLVDAAGVRSPLSRVPTSPLPFGALWASLDWDATFAPDWLEQRYERARKMVGVMPIGSMNTGGRPMAAFFWSLRHIDRAAFESGGIDVWKEQARTLWPQTEPLLQQIRSREDLVFASYSHRTMGSPLSREVVHIGDSWHCASPQLGQGANMALLDAFALATALERNDNLEEALGEYARMRLWHIRLYQAITWIFTPAYQSDSASIAWARDNLLAPLSRIWPMPPLLAGLVSGSLGWPLRMIGDYRPPSMSASAHRANV